MMDGHPRQPTPSPDCLAAFSQPKDQAMARFSLQGVFLGLTVVGVGVGGRYGPQHLSVGSSLRHDSGGEQGGPRADEARGSLRPLPHPEEREEVGRSGRRPAERRSRHDPRQAAVSLPHGQRGHPKRRPHGLGLGARRSWSRPGWGWFTWM